LYSTRVFGRTLISSIGIIWTAFWSIYSYLKPHKEKPRPSILVSREEVFEYVRQDREQREKYIKQELLRKGFSIFIAFFVCLIPVSLYMLLVMLMGEGGASQAGTGPEVGGKNLFKKIKEKCEMFYDDHFPANPNIIINLFLCILILAALPIFLGWVEVTKGWKVAIYTNSIAAMLTFTKLPVAVLSLIVNPVIATISSVFGVAIDLLFKSFHWIGNLFDSDLFVRIQLYFFGASGAILGGALTGYFVGICIESDLVRFVFRIVV